MAEWEDSKSRGLRIQGSSAYPVLTPAASR